MKQMERPLAPGDRGKAVVELQLRLAGFAGTVWDGIYGSNTEQQVRQFQKDYMDLPEPSGIFDRETASALRQFADEYPIEFAAWHCPCGTCGGFGQGRFRNEFRQGKPRVEAFHCYEYPGVHRALLHTFRAACFYLKHAGFPAPRITSGYRCLENNRMQGRESTNHMGKAVDFDFALQRREGRKEDRQRCDRARKLLMKNCNFQIGWSALNTKSLEPSDIAPTWVHCDVRCYDSNLLEDSFFVRSQEELDAISSEA